MHHITNYVTLNDGVNMVLSCGGRSLWWMIGGKSRRWRVSVQKVKDYVIGALEDGLNLGHGRSPLNPRYCLNVGY